jgi:hypothetical protein
MSRDKNTHNTHINPSHRQVGKMGPPVFFAFIDVRLENEPKNAIMFPEVFFMKLTVMFVSYLGVES